MKSIAMFLFSALLMACNSEDKSSEASASTPPTSQAAFPPTCYRYASESDTVTLKLVRTGEAVTGTLVYHLKEKDRNSGTIKGAVKENLLVADYTFLSEGMESVRQVAFKLEGHTLVEGYGNSIDKQGKMVFASIDSLNFNSAVKLEEIMCVDIR